jgi:capsular exopolysaccharide synthesis family protein
MSHVRNLFHRTSRPYVPSSPAVPVRAVEELAASAPFGPRAFRTPAAPEFPPPPSFPPVPEFPSTATAAAAPAATPASPATALADFPVEEARLHPEQRLVFYTNPHSPAADRFRYLRMRLREPWAAGKLKRLLITSPVPNDGKSTVTLNLATALSERGQRSVLVIDADLHNSRLAERLGLKARAGLSECLQDGLDPLSAIRRVEPFGWHLLPAGEPPSNATELLQAPHLAKILEQVSAIFDWILIDSPPAVPLTDAISLQAHAHASLLVIRAGHTPRGAVEQATALLGTKNMLGVIVNGLEPRNYAYGKYRSNEAG